MLHNKKSKMKTRIILTTLVLIGIFLNACENDSDIIASDNVTTQQYSFSDYDQINVESAFTVYVEFSDTEEAIEIEANDNLQQYIEVVKESGALIIRIQDDISIKGSATLNAYITTKKVTGYSASGASRFIVSDPVISNEATIFLSGASSFTGEIEVGNIMADLSGASNLKISGVTDSFDLNASGASVIGDFEFTTKYLDVSLSDASNASLSISENMDVVASGASTLRYKGDGTISSQNVTGGSSIIKID